jgi:hypothetical protein
VRNHGERRRKRQGLSTLPWKKTFAEENPEPLHMRINSARRQRIDVGEKRILDFLALFFHTSTDTTTTRFYLYLREKENRFPLLCGKGASRTPA